MPKAYQLQLTSVVSGRDLWVPFDPAVPNAVKQAPGLGKHSPAGFPSGVRGGAFGWRLSAGSLPEAQQLPRSRKPRLCERKFVRPRPQGGGGRCAKARFVSVTGANPVEKKKRQRAEKLGPLSRQNRLLAAHVFLPVLEKQGHGLGENLPEQAVPEASAAGSHVAREGFETKWSVGSPGSNSRRYLSRPSVFNGFFCLRSRGVRGLF